MRMRYLLLVTIALAGIGCSTLAADESTAEITSKVKSRLAADKDTSAMPIIVETEIGVVTLSGKVANVAQKFKAEQIAKNTEGVEDVVNDITVDPWIRTARGKTGGAAKQARRQLEASLKPSRASRNDTAILDEIESQLVANDILGTDVEVNNGEVTLRGEVKNAKTRAKAQQIVSKVAGAKNVKNQLTVRRTQPY